MTVPKDQHPDKKSEYDDEDEDDAVVNVSSVRDGFWRRSMDWLLSEMRRNRHRVPYCMEWLLSVSIVTCFAAKFLVDYGFHLYAMHRLRKSPSQWWHVVPLASLPQTKRQQQTKEDAYERLLELLRQNPKQDNKAQQSLEEFSDDHVIQTIQNSLEARLVASALMKHKNYNVTTITRGEETQRLSLKLQLERLWPRLLQIPSQTSTKAHNNNNNNSTFEISLIVPAYREPWDNVKRVLEIAYQRCQDPHAVQVILVLAGTNNNSKDESSSNKTEQHVTTSLPWLDLQNLCYTGEGGRGGCMNYGAQHARAHIYTFLHCDTILPDSWDTMIRAAIRCHHDDNHQVNLCAFGFDLDTTQQPPFPAMHIAVWQARIRSITCKFPYGDSALSIRATAFRHVGGFPHEQPLMEDYELVRLFRLRAGLFPDTEPILILPAFCYTSARRYVQYGVYYLALANWTIVSRYKSGTTAEELFQMYYQQPATAAPGTTTTAKIHDKPKQS